MDQDIRRKLRILSCEVSDQADLLHELANEVGEKGDDKRAALHRKAVKLNNLSFYLYEMGSSDEWEEETSGVSAPTSNQSDMEKERREFYANIKNNGHDPHGTQPPDAP